MLHETRTIMGMPVTVTIVDAGAQHEDLELVFAGFTAVDARFSPYKADSELSRINRGDITPADYSAPMREILALAEQTRADSKGYFNVRRPDGALDPSGIVKGWAIQRAAQDMARMGYENFSVEVAGDIQTSGHNAQGDPWRIGIRNPFCAGEVVKILQAGNAGIATSGTYTQGAHIYNPHAPGAPPAGLVSLTVIGPDIFEADRYATAAFAMGAQGICFIEQLPGFEAYEINQAGIARMTSGLERYLAC